VLPISYGKNADGSSYRKGQDSYFTEKKQSHIKMRKGIVNSSFAKKNIMDEIEEFVRKNGIIYLRKYAREGSIEIGKKYTYFKSKEGAELKIKNTDVLGYDYLRKISDIKLESSFKPVRTGLMAWLLGK
jgi:hypothetical protein